MTKSRTSRWQPHRYHRTAEYLFPASVAAVAAIEAEPGELVVDSGTGTGNGAVAATDRGYRVIGVDNSAAQIEEARRRLAGRDATFLVADAQEIPVPTASAAAGISIFGIIFATDPHRALAELTRCVRPGGQVIFTCLGGAGWPVASRELLAAELRTPAPPFPATWSTAHAAAAAADAAGLAEVRTSWEELRLVLDPDVGIADQVSSRMGVLAAQRDALDAAGRWSRAREELDELLGAHVRQIAGAPALVDDYLLVRGTRR